MSEQHRPERKTQNRVVALFRDELGYCHLSDWTDRDANSNVEKPVLTPWVARQGVRSVAVPSGRMSAP